MNKLTQINIGNEFFRRQVDFGSQDLSVVGKLVTLFVKGSFVLAGIVILFFFIVAGIGMIAGAGSNDPQKMEQSKKTATSALIGFTVVFTSYWIVKLIGKIIGIDILGI